MKKVNLQNIIEKNSEDKLRNNSKKVSSTLPDDSWLAKYKRGGGYFPKYHSFTAPRMDIGGKIGGEKETEPTATTNLPSDYRARWNNLQSYIRDQVGYDDANPITAQPKVRGFNETRTYVDQYNKLNPNTPFNTDWIAHIENELTGQIIPDKTRMAQKFGLDQKQPLVGGNRNIIGYRMLGQTYRYPDMKLVTSQGSKDLGIPGANYQMDAGSGYLGQQDLSNTGAGPNMAGLIPGKVYIDGKSVDVKVTDGQGYIMKPNGDVLVYDPTRYDARSGRYRQYGGDISIPNLSKNTWITKYKNGGDTDCPEGSIPYNDGKSIKCIPLNSDEYKKLYNSGKLGITTKDDQGVRTYWGWDANTNSWTDRSGSNLPEIVITPTKEQMKDKPRIRTDDYFTDQSVEEGGVNSNKFLTDWYTKRLNEERFSKSTINKRLQLLSEINTLDADLEYLKQSGAGAYYRPNTKNIYINKQDPYSRSTSVQIHEKNHVLDYWAPQNLRNVNNILNYYVLNEEDWLKYNKDKETYRSKYKDFGLNYGYWGQPTEIISRLNQFRYRYNIDPNKEYSNEEMQHIINRHRNRNPNLRFPDNKAIDVLLDMIGDDPNKLRGLNKEIVQTDNNKNINIVKKGGSLDKFIPKYRKGGKKCPDGYIRNMDTGDCIPDPTVEKPEVSNFAYEYSIDQENAKNKSKKNLIDKNNVVIDYVDPRTGKLKHKKIDRRSRYYKNLVDAKVLTGMTVDDKGEVHTEFNTSDKTPADVQELQEVVIDASKIPLKEGSVGKYTREFRRKNNFKDYVKKRVEKEKAEATGRGIGWSEEFNNGAIERATKNYYQEMNDYAASGLRRFNERKEDQDVSDWLDEFNPRQREILFNESGSEDLYNTYIQDAAERTRRKVIAGDENATYTFPDYYDQSTGQRVKGQTKAWKDMTFNEKNYVTGQKLSGSGQFNKEEDGELLTYLNYVNPFTIIPALAGQMAQVPYRTVTEKSPVPLLNFATNAFLTGKLSSLKTFNPLNKNFFTKGNFTYKPSNFEYANNLFVGIPGLTKGTYNFTDELIRGSIANKKFTFPKWKGTVRVEPDDFNVDVQKQKGIDAGILSSDAIETTTGNWFNVKNPKIELQPYLGGFETKAVPGQKFNVLGEIVPERKLPSMVQHVTPEGFFITPEGQTMSWGWGKHGSWKNVQAAHPEFTDAEIALLEKATNPATRESLNPFEIKDFLNVQNKVRGYSDLVNPTEALLKPEITNKYRNNPFAAGVERDEAFSIMNQFQNPFGAAVLNPILSPVRKGFRGIHAPVETLTIDKNTESQNLKKGGSTNWLNKYKQA